MRRIYSTSWREKTSAIAGEALMYAGIQIPNPWGDFQAKLLHFTAVESDVK